MSKKPPAAAPVVPVTVTSAQATQRTAILHNALYSAFGTGDVDTAVVSGRRLVFWQSLLDYIERQRLGLERDPAEKQAAAAAYARSLSHTGARGAAKARAGLLRKQQAARQHRGPVG